MASVSDRLLLRFNLAMTHRLSLSDAKSLTLTLISDMARLLARQDISQLSVVKYIVVTLLISIRLMENAGHAFLHALRKSRRQIRAASPRGGHPPDLLTAAERIPYEG
jgi:hypothetical protein